MKNSQKLEAVIDLMEHHRFTVKDFVRELACERHEPRYQRYWLQLKQFAFRDWPKGEDSLPKPRNDEWDRLLECGGNHRVFQRLRSELASLSREPACSPYQYPDRVQSDSLGTLGSIQATIGQKAKKTCDAFGYYRSPRT